MSVATVLPLDVDDFVSPELVLVDPELRARLARPGYASPRPTWDVARPRRAPAHPSPLAAQASVPDPPPARAGSRKPVVVAIAVALLAIGLSSVVGFSTGGGRTADPAMPMVPSASAPGAGAASPSAGQRIAWAPSPGATAYVVQLRRRGAPPYQALTARTSIVLPIGRADSRGDRLTPGLYTWYVWPVRDGQRATTPLVKSSLIVSRSR